MMSQTFGYEPGNSSLERKYVLGTVRMLLIQKNLRSFITVKAHYSMTHLKQQKSFGFF